MSGPITGIDVSAYQRDVDFAAVKDSGHAFAFIKATEGNGWVSRQFRKQFRDAGRAGLLRGAYHFARWESDGDPVVDANDEAAHFAEVVLSSGVVELPPVLDLEWITGEHRDPDELVLWARTFLVACERRFGRWPVLYTGPSFWRYCLLPDKRDLSLELTSWLLWIVDYTPGATQPRPMKDAPNWRWTFWQWTGQGACAGVRGKCDINRFNGTLDELHLLAGLGPQTKGD